MSRRQRRERQRRRRSATGPRAAHARLATGAGVSVAAALGAPAAAQATDFTVTTTADPAPGTCALGDCSLREAVEAAEGNATDDRILFQAGLTGTIALGSGQGQLDITKPLEVLGPGAAALGVSADVASRIFYIKTGPADPVTISGLTLSGGNSSNDGGAIYSGYASLTIRESTISGNDAAGSGGGVYTFSGTTTIEGSTISGNDAGTEGGGVDSRFDATTSIEDSTIYGNDAGTRGGGVYLREDMATIEGSTISGNDAVTHGGGVYTYQSTTTIAGSTISGNGADSNGGGVFSYKDTLTIEDSTISGNDADNNAGGAYLREGTTTIESSTISGNGALSEGGGLYLANNDTDPILTNTIVAANTAPTGPDLRGIAGDVFYAAFTLIGSTAGAMVNETVAGSNVTGESPQLGPLADNGGSTATRAPAITSPAVDAGSAPGPTDQRGLARPVNLPGIPNSTAAGANGAEIGAVELQLPSNAFTLGALKRNRRKGTATLAITVPGAGRLVLGGAKLRGQTKSPTGAGIVKLLIRAKGRAAKRLRRTGKATVRAVVTFTPTAPTAGNARTKSRKVRLVKRKRL